MKVLLSWLREFAPLEQSAAELGQVMDDLGMAVEELRPVALGGIVVARVVQTRPHPDADRIQLVDVETDGEDALQVCCGAFNMAVGDLVPLATVGTTMPNGLQIARRKMRGEWSNGMLCSPAELGLGDDTGGILILPDDLEPGVELAAALGLDGEALYDLEINPNRPDAMSVAGVARDLAARLDLPFGIPVPEARLGETDVAEAASVEIVDPDLCGRFASGVLRGVPTGPAPLAMRARLTLMGMRPISHVVDVSNYVMLELGTPNHAYDLARVPGGHLRVRRARQGETVTTLDGVERTVSEGDGLICDAEDRPIGLAGVMGGLDTEIGPETVDVLLEAAWWDAPSITRTSRRLKLYSEASSRFSRGTDPEMIPTAIARFAELLAPAGTALDRGLVDERGGLAHPPTIRVRTARVNAVLGTQLPAKEIRAELEPIGYACEPAADGFDVTIPTWRPDSALEIDVIEEVARHHGYARIGRTVPRSPDPGSLTPRQHDRHTVRDTLIGLGLDEAMPLPFLAPDDNVRAGLGDDRPIALLNPLDARESVLRTSLLPGLLKAVAYNGSHRNPGVRLFEIGHVYLPPIEGAELPDEREHVGAALAAADAGEAKLALDTLMDTLAVKGYRLLAADDLPGMHPTRGARVFAGDVEVGVVGEVDPGVLAAYEVDERVGWVELNLDRLLDQPHGATAYRPVSRFPSSDIDLAFIVDDAVPAAAVEATLLSAGGAELAELRLFDVYRGAQTGEGRRSLAFTLRFQAPDRTLTDDEVGAIRQRCIEAVETAHTAVLR